MPLSHSTCFAAACSDCVVVLDWPGESANQHEYLRMGMQEHPATNFAIRFTIKHALTTIHSETAMPKQAASSGRGVAALHDESIDQMLNLTLTIALSERHGATLLLLFWR